MKHRNISATEGTFVVRVGVKAFRVVNQTDNFEWAKEAINRIFGRATEIINAAEVPITVTTTTLPGTGPLRKAKVESRLTFKHDHCVIDIRDMKLETRDGDLYLVGNDGVSRPVNYLLGNLGYIMLPVAKALIAAQLKQRSARDPDICKRTITRIKGGTTRLILDEDYCLQQL